MSQIKNATVLVTGGASGIGRLLGTRCLEMGAKSLVIWDINEVNLEETAHELRNSGYEVYPYVVDVSDPEDIKKAAEEVFNEAGTVDILFNNAGIVVGKYFHEHSHSDIEKTIAINTSGVMHVALAFLPAMIEQHSGHIINIASAAGLTPNPKMAVYAGSKWAVLGWSESIRNEMGDQNTGVNVTTVTPSYIATGMFEGAKGPMFAPILEPDFIVSKILEAVEKNKVLVRQPFIVKILPFVRGILPAQIYDSVVGRGMRVYKSMANFKGRTSPGDVSKLKENRTKAHK